MLFTSRGKSKIILSTILTLLLIGCQYDPHAHLYTTVRPQASDIPGTYSLDRFDLTASIPMKATEVTLKLYPDGKFEALNIPPESLYFADSSFFSTLVSGNGRWEVVTLGILSGDKDIWGISLHGNETRFLSASFTGDKAPYGLIFTVGDPDGGDAVILRKLREN